MRDKQTLELHTAELQPLADEHGLPLFQAYVMPLQGAVLGLQARPNEGLEKVEQGIEMMARAQIKVYQPLRLLIRGELLRDLGHVEDALASIAEAINSASTREEHWIEPELHRVRGNLYSSLSRESEAEAAFSAAIAIARNQASKWWEIRTAVSLARRWQGQSKVVEARELLAPIYNWFSEGFDTPGLMDAKTLLDELA